MTQYNLENRLIVKEYKNYLRNKAKIIAEIRNFLDNQDFIEIETPILYPYPEVAPMEQFKVLDPTTGHTYYMRVCPTEHLKRMMIAGFEKVYEFSRNFRPGNSSDETHSSEFTSLECSQLGATYKDMMILTETIVGNCIKLIKNSTKVIVDDREFDVKPPWDRISVQEALLSEIGVDILTIESPDELKGKIDEDLNGLETMDQIIDDLIETRILPNLRKPTFLTEYPYKLGGPAKPLENDPRSKQRCEAFIGSLEIANMSSHLNEVTKLYNWHMDTMKIKKDVGIGDAIFDEPLFEAINLGFPDSAVVGIGIDRLSMLANDVPSIKQVIPFPFELM